MQNQHPRKKEVGGGNLRQDKSENESGTLQRDIEWHDGQIVKGFAEG